MALPSTDTNVYTDNVDTAAKLFTEHGSYIRTVIRYHVKNENQADDLFQDFFLFLVTNPLPADVRNIKGFLYRAITNRIIDAIRRIENYKKHKNNYIKCLNNPINKKTPEKAFIEAEETRKMFELIEAQLRPTYSRAITLRYRNNCNIKEIANKMNVGSESARKYITRGLAKMRCFLTNNKTRH
jgi:RNA polymerase sigma factor (sigma-70 family)